MKKLMLMGVVCALVLAAAGPMSAENASLAAFEKLKSLAGDWESHAPDGTAVRVTYRVTSAGSVVVETIMPGQPMEMLTLYHPDGDSVIATHYCAAQNQPRMRARHLSGEGNELAFEFLDVTNLTSPDAEHMREVVFTFQDNDHFTARWTSREKGKDTPGTFTYTRRK